jgi:putative ABC transport system ATP-binding protein
VNRDNFLDQDAESLISLRGLTKTFEFGGFQRKVLDAVNVEIAEGEFIVLLGKSGSGKSTLLNLVSGIETPTMGDIFISGLGINRLSDRDRTLFRRDNIGFIFQFFNLIPTLTVLENITLPLELAGHSQKSLRTGALDLIKEVGLDNREDDFPDKLSGGEQQRVAIARALAHRPLLILADEPTGNLDEETGARVLQLLLKMSKSAGKTLILATHNLDIAGLADKVYQIHNGKLILENH